MKSFPILAALLLAACTTAPPPPRLSAVTPPRVSAFLVTQIALKGEAIEYAISADLDRPSRSTYTLDLRVRLIGPQTVELNAERLSATEVSATVPAALPLGKYTVELSTARGVATLIDGLEIGACLLDCERGPDDGGCFSWPDLDRDSYGRLGAGAALCADDAGVRVTRGGDCHDGDPATHPDAFERCNGIDDDCDGVIDDAACPHDAGWVVRMDTGNSGYDWETAASFGRGKVWLAEKQRVFLRNASGAFADVSGSCANKLSSSWADPVSGLAVFGGDGVVTSHTLTAAGCGAQQNVNGTVSGLQGFGARIFGATRDGTLLEGTVSSLTQRAGFGSGVTVNDVQGASPASLFAVGSVGARPKVWRMSTDGGTFVDENVQLLPVADQALTAVWVVDDALAYAVGAQGALLERTGGTWRALAGADGGLRAVRAFGAGRVYAATADGRVLRFDGAKWQVVYKHPGSASFTDIAASAEDDLWVVGANGLVVHWYE